MNKRVLVFIFCSVLLFGGCGQKSYKSMEGSIYGTYYRILYLNDQDLSNEIRQEMERVNTSLSMFNKNSVVSRLNRNEIDEVDSLFERLFVTARQINRNTSGAFDITVAPLVNAWGFGYKHDSLPSAEKIDSLMNLVGMEKLSIVDGKLVKKLPGIEIDASSIAKGLGVDLVTEYFDAKGIGNYMADIGGEIRVKGQSNKNRSWRIGIDKPEDDPAATERNLQMVVGLTEGALATSGNYRNFYVRDGKKYGHTINPATGYPVQRDILSSSVYAPTCMEADAYATAFMVLGLEESRKIVERTKGLEVCFIYEDQGVLKTWMTDRFKKIVLSE